MQSAHKEADRWLWKCALEDVSSRAFKAVAPEIEKARVRGLPGCEISLWAAIDGHKLASEELLDPDLLRDSNDPCINRLFNGWYYTICPHRIGELPDLAYMSPFEAIINSATRVATNEHI